jgi:hypothetical protein
VISKEETVYLDDVSDRLEDCFNIASDWLIGPKSGVNFYRTVT